jgi:DNA replication protein DnaC
MAARNGTSQRPRTALECSGVGPRHCQSSFENFEGNEQLVKTCNQMLSQGKDVILSGQTGCGKTHLAVAMVREFLQRNQGAVFIPVPQLLLKIRSAFAPHPAQTEQDLVERYSGCKLLVLDDLGAEKTTEFSIATLYLILDQRIRHMRQTIVTTNLTLQAIEHSLGARIASRLAGMRVIRIGMPDWRKNRLIHQS